jgi:hypothetical protein
MPPTDRQLSDRLTAALGRLLDLVKSRAVAEASTAEAFTAGTAAADKEVQKAKRAIAAARAKAVADAADAHRQAVADITGRADAALAENDRHRQDLRKKTVDQYSTALQKQRSEYEDRQWTNDSQQEAWEKEARGKHDDLMRAAAEGAAHVDRLWADAEPTLNRAGLTTDDVRYEPNRLPPATKTDPVGKLQKCREDADAAAERLAAAPLPKILGIGGTALCVVLAGGLGAAVTMPFYKEFPNNLILVAAWAVVGGLILRVAVGRLAKRQVRERGSALGVYLAECERAVESLRRFAAETFAAEKADIAARHAVARKQTDDHYRPRIARLEEQLSATLTRIDADHVNKGFKLRADRDDEAIRERRRYEAEAEALTAKATADEAAAEAKFSAAIRDATAARDRSWNKLSSDWHTGVGEVGQELRELTAIGSERFPPWKLLLQQNRPHPEDVPPGIRFGSVSVDLAALPDGMPTDDRLKPADPIKLTVPAYLPFPARCSTVLRAADDGRPAAVAALQAMMLRFLTGLPPGKVRFTVIDPVGLGENFGSFMHLADADEKLVTSRIWTEPQQIEKRLLDLTEHMENVIQKYLRNQYKSIEEYNRAAGEVAEPYRVLVVANFPHNFTPEAARRLISIASSGPACGVCTLVSVDTKAGMPRDFRLADLEQVSFNLAWDGTGFKPADPTLAAFPLTVDQPPAPEAIAALVRRVGAASLEAAKVEVPFDYIMPAPDRVWAGDASKGFDVPIGRAGATRRQNFVLGRGTAQHALVAGKTGSGKSTLLHALITNLALIYGPEEAELYLIDFKEGVEFKPYAVHHPPHVRVVAIESEREFGLSVLQRLDGILRERGDAFRQAGVNDLAGYRESLKQTDPSATCPRILLVVDEFQMFFVEDDKLSQEAALLLDRLVRQGRAFGVHVLLGSQTLGGAYSLPRATIDQMAVRIALQCSEADAQLILSKDNTAARLLNRPGEAIYNDANGRVEGNDPFQVVWLDEDRREQLLTDLRRRAGLGGKRFPPPLVFEGNSSADLTKNDQLAGLLAGDAPADGPVTVWLGEPVAIKDPTVAVFRPASANNLLLLGQQEESALALNAAALTALAGRLRPTNGDRPVLVVDGTPDDSEFADYLRHTADAVGLTGAFVERSALAATVSELAAEVARRQSGESADRSPRFLLVHGLHRLRELRKPEDDFGFGRKGEKVVSPGEAFATILRDGPPVGVHVIAWCDGLVNLQRALDRQAVREFALRVLFQMSPADSSNLIDSPAASRLGRNRAFFVEEGVERPEKFRPYGLPAMSWLRRAGQRSADASPVAAG